MQADLLSHFKTLEDPRIDRTKRYPLIEIIFLIISATISGCDGWCNVSRNIEPNSSFYPAIF